MLFFSFETLQEVEPSYCFVGYHMFMFSDELLCSYALSYVLYTWKIVCSQTQLCHMRSI